MENYIIDLIKNSLIYFDNQNFKYKKFLKNTKIYIFEKKIIDSKTDIDIDDNLKFETELLGIFSHTTNIFIWSWSLPNVNANEIKISRELLNYGLQLEQQSNTIIHFFLKSLLVNARNYIENDYDLDLIQAIASYILKDKYNFIYPVNLYNSDKKTIITSYFLVKISSNK